MGTPVCASCGGAGIHDGVPCSACGGPPLAAPGTFGKYSLDHELGRGSMGVVFDARDTTLDRRVALKVLFDSRSEDPREALRRWQRFMQEARLTAGLAKHPGVVTLYEAGVQDGRRFLAMEYIAGEPFHRWRAGRSTRDQIRVLRDVAVAVHHAHEQGIVHRDLKPANVLVQSGGHPVVTDFGLATTELRNEDSGLTPSGVVVGSPAYMSPEQARGNKAAGRTPDIYALGVMLYETVAGRLPFEGRTPVETLSKVMDGTKLPPSRNVAGALADPTLDAVCLRAMALEPERRHPNAQAFGEDLSRWLGDRAPARPPRVLPAVVLGALLGASAVLSVALVLSRRASDREAEARRELDAALQSMRPRLDPPFPVALESFVETPGALFNTVDVRRIEFKTSSTFEAPLQILETGDYRILVSAEGEAARGEHPRFHVLCNGRFLGEAGLTREAPGEYEVRSRLPAGEFRLGLRFVNDFYDEAAKEDRNLRILGVVLLRAP